MSRRALRPDRFTAAEPGRWIRGSVAYDEALAERVRRAQPHVRPFDFTGRASKGVVYVGSGALGTARQLRAWIDDALSGLAAHPTRRRSPKKKK